MAGLKIADVPESITDDGERKTYLAAYNQFYVKYVASDSPEPDNYAEHCHSAAQKAVEKERKAGARNSALDMADIQAIHDKAFTLGAKCRGEANKSAKALDLERRVYKVRQAWQVRFNPHYPGPKPTESYPQQFWVKAVFDDFVLVENMETKDLFRYEYVIEDSGEVVFEDTATQVQIEVVEVGKALTPQKETIKTRWTCGIEGHEHDTIKVAQECISQTTLNTPSVRAEFVKSIYSNNSLKTVSKTENELVVANYLVLFNARDLEGIMSRQVNEDGTKGEYFTKATVLESDYTNTGQLLIDWEHRKQPDSVGPDEEDIFGYVDWKSAVVDDTGLFVKRVLNRRNRYIKILEALFDAGMIGNSTEPIQKEVSKASDGQILTWPLKRDSCSVMPMDWRMMTSNHLEVVKALKDDPDGIRVYDRVFNQETAQAKAKSLALINQIGETAHGVH